MASQFEEKAAQAAKAAQDRIAAERAAIRARQQQEAAAAAPLATAAAPAAPAAPEVPEGYMLHNGQMFMTLNGLTSSPAWTAASHASRVALFKQWKSANFEPLIKMAGDKKHGNPEAAKAQQLQLSNWEKVHMMAPGKRDSILDTDLVDIPFAALTSSIGGVLKVTGDAFGGQSLSEYGQRMRDAAKKYEDDNLSATTKDKALQEGERATKRLYDALLNHPEYAQSHLNALQSIANNYGGDITKIPVTDPRLQALTQDFDKRVGLGVWEEAKGAVADVAAQPLNKTLQSLGAMAPALLAGAATGGAGPLIAAAAGAGTNAVMTAGEAASDYDKIMAMSHEQMLSVSPDYAERLSARGDTPQNRVDVQDQLALDAQNKGAVGRALVAATTGWVGRGTGLDSVVTGAAAKLAKKGGRSAAVKHIAGSAGEEFGEEAGVQLAGNAALRTVDTTQSLGEGVVAAGVQGAVIGAGMGAPAAAIGNRGERADAAVAQAANRLIPIADRAYSAATGAARAFPAVGPNQTASTDPTIGQPGFMTAEPTALPDTATSTDPTVGQPGFMAPPDGVGPSLALTGDPRVGPSLTTSTDPMLGPPVPADADNPLAAAARRAVQNPASDPSVGPPVTLTGDPTVGPSAATSTSAEVGPLLPEGATYENPLAAAAQRARQSAKAQIAATVDSMAEQQHAIDLRALTHDLEFGDVYTDIYNRTIDSVRDLVPADIPVVNQALADSAHPTNLSIVDAIAPTTTTTEELNGQPATGGIPGATGGAGAAADVAGTGNVAAGLGSPAPAAVADTARAVDTEPAGVAPAAEPRPAERAAGDVNPDGGRAQPQGGGADAPGRQAQGAVREGRGAEADPTVEPEGGQRGGRGTAAGGAADGAAQHDVTRQGKPGRQGRKPTGGPGVAGSQAVVTTPQKPAERVKPKGGQALATGAGSRAVNKRVVDAKAAIEDAKALPNLTVQQGEARRVALERAKADHKVAVAAQATFAAVPSAPAKKLTAKKVEPDSKPAIKVEDNTDEGETRPNSVTAFTSDNKSHVVAEDQGPGRGYRITSSEVDMDARGQGLGKGLYKSLVDNLLARGEAVQSDTTVSVDAARVYDSMAKEGYNVHKHPDAVLITNAETPHWTIDYDTPVYTVLQKTAPAKVAPTGSVKFAPDVTPDVRGVVSGWVKLLGLDGLNITVGSARAQSMPLAADGAIDHRADGSKVILFKRQLSDRKTLETLGHELGHALQQHSFETAPAATKAAIKAAHAAWLETHKDSTDAQLVRALRPYGNGRVGSSVGTLSGGVKAYATSFNEWFADNVAKWATSADKPRGVVEQFFSDLGEKLREFFQKAPEMHKPDATVAAWLDTLGTRGVGEIAARADDGPDGGPQGGLEFSGDFDSESARVAENTAAEERIPGPIGQALSWAAAKWSRNDRPRTVEAYRAQALGQGSPKVSRVDTRGLGGRILNTFVDTGVQVETAFSHEVVQAEHRAQQILESTGATGALRDTYRAALDRAVARLKDNGAKIALEMRLWHNKADAYFEHNNDIIVGVQKALRDTLPEGMAADAWRLRANLYAQAVHIIDRHAAKATELTSSINVAKASMWLSDGLLFDASPASKEIQKTLSTATDQLKSELGRGVDESSVESLRETTMRLHAKASEVLAAARAAVNHLGNPAAVQALNKVLNGVQVTLDHNVKAKVAVNNIDNLQRASRTLSDLLDKPAKLAAKLYQAEADLRNYNAANTNAPRQETNSRGETVDVFDFPLPGGVQLKTAQEIVSGAGPYKAALEEAQRSIVGAYRALAAQAVKAGMVSEAELKVAQEAFPNYVSLAGDSQREVTDVAGSRKRSFLDSLDGATHANQAAMPDENLGHKLKQLASQVGRAHLDALLLAHADMNRHDLEAPVLPGSPDTPTVPAQRLELPTSTIVRLASDFGAEQSRPKDLHVRTITTLLAGDHVSQAIAIDNPGVVEGLFETPVIENDTGRRAAAVTRALGQAVTRWTLAFAPINYVRDLGEGVFNVAGLKELDEPQKRSVQAHMLATLKNGAMWSDAFGYARAKDKATWLDQHPDSPLAHLSAVGGLLTMTQHIKNESQAEKAFLNQFSVPAQALSKVKGFFDSYNEMFEVMVPMAKFTALQKVAGLDAQSAAGVAIRMFDLRARGTVSPHMNAVYTFFAPNAYGASTFWRTLTSSRTAQIDVLKGVAVASALYAFARGMDDEDENGNPMMDAQSEQTTDGTFLIPLGGGSYFHVPMPYGLARFAWVLGARGVRVAAGVDTPWDGVAAVLSETVKSTLPTGVSSQSFTDDPASWLLKTFTPSTVKVLANLATNTNFAGTPLTYAHDETKYKSDQGQASTPEIYTDMAQTLREASGNKLDMAPEHMREALGGVLVGPLAAIIPMLTAGDKASKGLSENALTDGYSGAMVKAIGAGRFYHEQSDEARHQFLARKLATHALSLVKEVNARIPPPYDEDGKTVRESREDKLARAEAAGLEGPDLATLDAYFEWQSGAQGVGRKLTQLRRKGEERAVEEIRAAVLESDDLMKTFIAAGAAQ